MLSRHTNAVVSGGSSQDKRKAGMLGVQSPSRNGTSADRTLLTMLVPQTTFFRDAPLH